MQCSFLLSYEEKERPSGLAHDVFLLLHAIYKKKFVLLWFWEAILNQRKKWSWCWSSCEIMDPASGMEYRGKMDEGSQLLCFLFHPLLCALSTRSTGSLCSIAVYQGWILKHQDFWQWWDSSDSLIWLEDPLIGFCCVFLRPFHPDFLICIFTWSQASFRSGGSFRFV